MVLQCLNNSCSSGSFAVESPFQLRRAKLRQNFEICKQFREKSTFSYKERAREERAGRADKMAFGNHSSIKFRFYFDFFLTVVFHVLQVLTVAWWVKTGSFFTHNTSITPSLIVYQVAICHLWRCNMPQTAVQYAIYCSPICRFLQANLPHFGAWNVVNLVTFW